MCTYSLLHLTYWSSAFATYGLILYSPNPAAVPTQSPLPTIVFYAYSVPCVYMQRINMSSNPT